MKDAKDVVKLPTENEEMWMKMMTKLFCRKRLYHHNLYLLSTDHRKNQVRTYTHRPGKIERLLSTSVETLGRNYIPNLYRPFSSKRKKKNETLQKFISEKSCIFSENIRLISEKHKKFIFDLSYRTIRSTKWILIKTRGYVYSRCIGSHCTPQWYSSPQEEVLAT